MTFTANRVIRTGAGIIVTIPLRTSNPLNGSHHNWYVAAKKRSNERKIVGLEMLAARPLPPLPIAVRLTRFGKGTRFMDADGLSASFKTVRDSVAEAYGIDDADNRITFLPCEQQRAKEYAVRIEVVRTCGGTGKPAEEGGTL